MTTNQETKVLSEREIYFATKHVNDALEAAFDRWKKQDGRDYDQYIIYMMENGIPRNEAQAILYVAFMEGYDAERKT